jgi:hypothetical protein
LVKGVKRGVWDLNPRYLKTEATVKVRHRLWFRDG